MPELIAGIEIPNSSLAREATELVHDSAGELLYNHSRRVFLFGSLQGQHRGWSYEPELLYIGAMFHDLGLTEKYRTSQQRFEMDGADAARDFLLRHGIPQQSTRLVWNAIALHTTPEVPYQMEPEVALVTAGVEFDVLGIGMDAVPDKVRGEVVAAHPRPDFKNRILHAFTEGFRHRPASTFGTVNADVLERFSPGFERINFVEVIENSAWPE